MAISREGTLNQAITSRNEGKTEESNKLLVELAKQFPDNALVNYQCAWSFDVLGEEAEAVPYYKKAIELGLSGKDLEGAIIGLGSTWRTLGEYEKSQKVFLNGIELFPENRAIRVFYSMTLYNLKQHSQAMEILLRCLAETTSDEEIISYKKAIGFYARDLDKVWN